MQLATDPLVLAISSCLIGEEVRYDGGHKKDHSLMKLLGEHVRWVPVCPEVEAGMGTPREPVKLVASTEGRHMVGVSSGTDHTSDVTAVANRRAEDLRDTGIAGYVFKSRSPSCGLWDTPIEGEDGPGRGLYAATLTALMPDLPVEDEARMADPVVRDNFIERAFAYRRLDGFFSRRRTPGQVSMFHSQSTLQLMSHTSAAAVEGLAAMVAEANAQPEADFSDYRMRFMNMLAQPARRETHLAALSSAAERIQGMTRDDRVELAEAIDRFANAAAPLLVPLTLLMHHVRETKDPYLHGQTYLDPDPRELLLRYHA